MIHVFLIALVFGPESFMEASIRARMLSNFVRHNVYSAEEISSPKTSKDFRSQSVPPRSKEEAEMFLHLSIESESPQSIDSGLTITPNDEDDSSTDDSKLSFLLEQDIGLWAKRNVPISYSWQFWHLFNKNEYRGLWDLELEEKASRPMREKEVLFYIQIQSKKTPHLKNHSDAVLHMLN